MPQPRRRPVESSILLAVALSVLLVPGTSSASAADEIPHENYDLMESNLEFVIMMLNTSIRYSERALMCMYNQTMVLAEQNLSAVRSILVPAERVLDDIKDLAGSYGNLSALIPPFADLSRLMDGFAADENSLIAARGAIVQASALRNLTGGDLIAALDAISRFNALIVKMNAMIDDMLVAAQEVSDLSAEDRRPFVPNQLIPLIEKLRDLLILIEAEVARIIEQELPLGETEPFLMLWISASSYYLGDRMAGGGYLFFNGSFAPGYNVRIIFDGALLTSAATASRGRFSFSYLIPLNGSWVGDHQMHANCTTPVGLLTSDVLSLRISLIPTVMSFDLSLGTMSIEDSVTGHVFLRDFRGNPLGTDACRLVVDGEGSSFSTGGDGRASMTWEAAQLGYGRHSMRAFYDGEVPYAPSSSALREVVVDIPTTLDLRLFSNEIRMGQYIVGNGTLFANGTQRLPGQSITLFLDGVVVANLTTGADGEFAFTIDSGSLTLGGHTLRAAFLERDLVWRYSQDEESFTLKGFKEGKHPFWPIIPGWGGDPGDWFPYLFIGRNAYFFWLLLLAFAAVTIRALQMRKRAMQAASRAPSEELEPMDAAIRASGAPAAPEETAFAMPLPTEGPANPNERIIWYYQRFLAFLTRKGWGGLRASMTHREVARILKAWGYPHDPVEDATMLFERAMYSGADLTDEDAVNMSAAMTSLIRPDRRRVPGAV